MRAVARGISEDEHQMGDWFGQLSWPTTGATHASSLHTWMQNIVLRLISQSPFSTVIYNKLPVVVLNRDTYFSMAQLSQSVSLPELPRFVVAVWPHDDVQGACLQVPRGSAGGSKSPCLKFGSKCKHFRPSLMAARCRKVYSRLPLPYVVVTQAVT
jgi:hypothetical protein